MSHAVALHRQSTHADLQTMAATLTRVLGRMLTAAIVGVRNPKTISRWSSGEVATVRDRYSEERLISAYQIVDFLAAYEGESTIRHFMLGMNPELNDATPANMLQQGEFEPVMAAARAFVADSY